LSCIGESGRLLLIVSNIVERGFKDGTKGDGRMNGVEELISILIAIERSYFTLQSLVLLFK
jgi:hypothetical protein